MINREIVLNVFKKKANSHSPPSYLMRTNYIWHTFQVHGLAWHGMEFKRLRFSAFPSTITETGIQCICCTDAFSAVESPDKYRLNFCTRVCVFEHMSPYQHSDSVDRVGPTERSVEWSIDGLTAMRFRPYRVHRFLQLSFCIYDSINYAFSLMNIPRVVFVWITIIGW